MHPVTINAFQYFVGRNSGIKVEATGSNDNIEAGFYSEAQATKFAHEIHDSLNFVMIYDEQGKTVHAFGPNSK